MEELRTSSEIIISSSELLMFFILFIFGLIGTVCLIYPLYKLNEIENEQRVRRFRKMLKRRREYEKYQEVLILRNLCKYDADSLVKFNKIKKSIRGLKYMTELKLQ